MTPGKLVTNCIGRVSIFNQDRIKRKRQLSNRDVLALGTLTANEAWKQIEPEVATWEWPQRTQGRRPEYNEPAPKFSDIAAGPFGSCGWVSERRRKPKVPLGVRYRLGLS